ncbi:type IV pilin-like G/H family protein [Crocosphaera sp. UHCC 0190]|uniref:type IV pilin-like G/H family protein n=1 Tax=Crocosphaera sp. UHCC 0190 TaxID=3110246 RepID=UPI002B1FE1B6|nr:type IV pilin-like G/H family protein [Crocosphaera sp. UHCC 0190]
MINLGLIQNMTQLFKTKVLIYTLVLGTGIVGFSLITQAEDQADQDQNIALQVVAKMTEAQRTYYQNNGNFRAPINDLKKDFDLTLPPTFNYAVRTTSEAAYSYVIPAQSKVSGQLKAYVGGAFITPNQTPKITTIICESTKPGQIRPADPQLVRGTDLANPTKLALQCGDFSVRVPDSKVTF